MKPPRNRKKVKYSRKTSQYNNFVQQKTPLYHPDGELSTTLCQGPKPLSENILYLSHMIVAALELKFKN